MGPRVMTPRTMNSSSSSLGGEEDSVAENVTENKDGGYEGLASLTGPEDSSLPSTDISSVPLVDEDINQRTTTVDTLYNSLA